MADENGDIEWFRPDPRAILPLDGFIASRSLRKSARKYRITFDAAFEEVMRACARPEGTWISEEFVRVYGQMFHAGKAHSAEAWYEEELAGGVYGVALGGAFMAESMFHAMADAGKAALWALVERLRSSGYQLMDVQFMTPHLRSLGAKNIKAAEYALRLNDALALTPDW